LQFEAFLYTEALLCVIQAVDWCWTGRCLAMSSWHDTFSWICISCGCCWPWMHSQTSFHPGLFQHLYS